VNLLGIDSVYCPAGIRIRLWDRMANDLKPPRLLDRISREVPLENVGGELAMLLEGAHYGRTIVRL
jgi:hypothetical protein